MSDISGGAYVRNSKAIGVLWASFSACYVVIVATAFETPDWIGNGSAKVGLYRVCVSPDTESHCNFNSVRYYHQSDIIEFPVAAVFVGVAALTALMTVFSMLFFLCCHSSTVFFTCGWMQLFSGICLAVGCAIFPFGWHEEVVRNICNNSDRFVLGQCGIRWGLILAIIGTFDAVILSILAFILATRYVTQSETDSVYRGNLNTTYLGDSVSYAGSKKSLNLHPIFLMHPNHQDDTASQFSRAPSKSVQSIRSKYSFSHLPYSAQDFHA